MSVKDFLFPSKAGSPANQAVSPKTEAAPPKVEPAPAKAEPLQAPRKWPRNIGMVIHLDPETMLRLSIESEDK
jgi:hypothetical protein